MSENKEFEAGFGSDFSKDPVRIVFITKKTSAKVKGGIRDHVMSYPHVVLREVIAFQLLTVVLVLISLFWDAPLEQVANPLVTPNPAKAPWYFLGLQELLHYFPPIMAGVLIPALVVIALVIIPYFNVNVQGEPLWSGAKASRLWIFCGIAAILLVFFGVYEAWSVLIPTVIIAVLAVIGYFVPPGTGSIVGFLRSRALSWWLMTWFIAVAIVLTIVGTYFRGPGWSWIWPWR
jgi:menaquinol-cytochrome c reductase cytochrome b/c subunit